VGKSAKGLEDAGRGSSLVADMLVLETVRGDTNGVRDPAGSVTSFSEPDLNQNRLYVFQSIERGKFVIRLVESLAGKDLWSAIVSRLCQSEQLPAPLAILQQWEDMRAGKCVEAKPKSEHEDQDSTQASTARSNSACETQGQACMANSNDGQPGKVCSSRVAQ
jgi:hypothetical protein